MPDRYSPSRPELLQIGWRQSFVWDVRFNRTLWNDSEIPDPPQPFGAQWFPATDASIDLYSTKDFDFSGGVGNFQVPSEIQPRSLQLTFIDTQDGVLQNWLEDWVQIIYPYQQFGPVRTERRGGFVKRLSKIVSGLELAQLSSTLSPSVVYRFLIYPTGTYQPVFNSASQIAPLSVNFVVAGFDKDRLGA